MNLHEYQAKQLFKKYNLPVQDGYICYSLEDIKKIAKLDSVDFSQRRWVAKCQIHAGGRGNAGGIIHIRDKKMIFEFANKWFGHHLNTDQTDIKGLPVNAILIEKAADVVKQFYLGAIIDQHSQSIVVMVSAEGGIDIELIADSTSHVIHQVTLSTLKDTRAKQGTALAIKLGFKETEIDQFAIIFMQFTELFLENDILLAEINPLVITQEGKFVCLDAKVVIDDNALYRQPELSLMRDVCQEDEREYLAAKCGFSYVSLNGNIGCMVNGAGLAMATMDIIHLYGGKPANFLDVGGTATKGRITEAFKLILSDSNVNVILINIFGGIVRCDFIAEGVIAAVRDMGLVVPIVVRLEGNNADIARQLLLMSQFNIITAEGLADAVKKVMQIR